MIDRLRGAGATPVLVGGSALYTRAILDRFEFPGTDEALRASWSGELAERRTGGPPRRLAERDPDAAARILPDNGRRIVRALEVIELTGRPSAPACPRLEYADPLTVQIGVDIDRPTLDERIARAGRRDVRAGFVEEVRPCWTAASPRAVRRRGRSATARWSPTCAATSPWHEAREQTEKATRRFARRQDGWFRKDPRIVWVGTTTPTGSRRRWRRSGHRAADALASGHLYFARRQRCDDTPPTPTWSRPCAW